uniref:Uncharacterized protein n=1 Tax=Leersia perrieri TaxID=77586 RepID=A0A0D9XS27_9ORYZ
MAKDKKEKFHSVFHTRIREGFERCGYAALLMKKEKYHPYYPRAAVMCQLAVSTLCKHTRDMVLQRVVMDMIPQGGLVRKSCPSNDVCYHKKGCSGVVLHVTISRKLLC